MTTNNAFKVQTSVGKADVWKISDHYYAVMYGDADQPRVVSANEVDKYFEDGAWQKVVLDTSPESFTFYCVTDNPRIYYEAVKNTDGYTIMWNDDEGIIQTMIYSEEQVRSSVDGGAWNVVTGFEECGQEGCTNILQQIKEFTDNYTVEVTIHNGIYQILDAENGDIYRANSDEELVKIMNAMKLLADAVVEV